MSEELLDIVPLWQDDLVAFTIGCSFSFEQALLDAGTALNNNEWMQWTNNEHSSTVDSAVHKRQGQ